MYDPAPTSGSSVDSGGNYIQLATATLLSIELDESGSTVSSWDTISCVSGVFPRKKVKGSNVAIAQSFGMFTQTFIVMLSTPNDFRWRSTGRNLMMHLRTTNRLSTWSKSSMKAIETKFTISAPMKLFQFLPRKKISTLALPSKFLFQVWTWSLIRVERKSFQ